MKTAFEEYNRIVSSIPDNIAGRWIARSIGKRPCEITKWLSGQHNFTLSTLAMLSSFFGQPIITVG